MESQEDTEAATRGFMNFVNIWKKKIDGIIIRKEHMNKLVMDLLVTEGHVDAAKKFISESGAEQINLDTILDRWAVRKDVESGDIDDAIGKINELNPEILDKNPLVFFRLQQQRFIEYIRNGKIEEALEIAQEELAPCAEKFQSISEELERTVALLAFRDPTKSPIGEFMNMSQRQKTAREINAAILVSQGREKDPKLIRLLKTREWVQIELAKMDGFPHAYFSDPSSSNS